MTTWDKKFESAMKQVGDSENRRAGMLDVTRQAIATWMIDQNVPIHRALALEKITKGTITWRDLAPRLAVEVDAISEYVTARR